MNEQTSNIDKFFSEVTSFERNVILPRKMAAVGEDINNVLGGGGKGERETIIQNGRATPEATPDADAARTEADKARQAAAANGQTSTETENPHSGDELSDYETGDDSDGEDGENTEGGMDGVEGSDQIPWPTTFVQSVYQEATPHLGKLLLNPTDLAAMGALKALNDKIKQQNEKDEIQPDQWIIDYTMFAAEFNMAKPYYDRLLKRGEGVPADEESLKKLEEINATLRQINTKHYFPETWVINPPNDEAVAKAQAARKEADEAQAKKKGERKAKKKAEEEAKKKAVADKVAKEAAEKAAAEKAAKEAAEKAAAEKAAKEAAEKAAAEKRAKFGNIEFPWVTYPLPTGERIISGRQRTKDDVAGSLCCVELPCTNPEDPTFEFRDDIDIFELQKYFATPGIKLMGETDEKGRPVRVWRKVDRKDFREFLFCVVGKRERSDLRKRTTPVCPETLCCVMMANGVDLLNKTGLLNMVGKKAEEGYIRRYCKKKGITSPWDVEPNSYIISKEQKAQLDNTQAGSTTWNSGAGHSTSGRTTVSSPAGISDIKSLQDQMAALERKFDGFQPSTSGGSSLDSVLAKLENRMASIEKKVDKVDSLEATTSKLAGYLESLAARFDKLEKDTQGQSTQ
jgi:hypothetical protein